ncbi:hypothetical protein [Leptospira perdikensis]|uniref:Uncharacterized protein n=1 Tax=Leptospira perdikensis TaxID=2484948 RepID=A0A4R9JN26_9LEPT|nr:hypothetical protein [Leptospira perdikensis]TGL45835.1 hypothetical protein EHQ49_00155 [Leptospira perdikensis]
MFRIPVVLIFGELSEISDKFAILTSFIFREVYYLKLIGAKTNDRVVVLQRKNIKPLPIADLPSISSFADADSDPKEYTWQWVHKHLKGVNFDSLRSLFPNVRDLNQKIRLYLLDNFSLKQSLIASKLTFWSENNNNKKIIYLSFRMDDIAVPLVPKNCVRIILPISFFGVLVRGVFNVINRFKQIFSLKAKKLESLPRVTADLSPKFDWAGFKLGYVTHAGLSYGSLFEKKLYHSEKDPIFKIENVVHYDYSGIPSPGPHIPWWQFRSAKSLKVTRILLVFIQLTLSNWRLLLSPSRLVCFLLIVILKLKFDAYLLDLKSFPNLKLALIDYEILCPKALLFAFESKGVKTLAVQERFVYANYKSIAVILDYYLVASAEVVNLLKKSKNYLVNHIIPVGQYRTDALYSNYKNELKLQERMRKNGYKFSILFLGYHTHDSWEDEQVDPLLNWKAHLAFLEDILRLSKELNDSILILRYKNLDWLKLHFFSEVVSKINSIKNIEISSEYSIPFFSYSLAKNVDLVIAKHTSLGDEVLSFGKPVLFYDFTHNSKTIIADTYGYHGSEILCKNYEELLTRSKRILKKERTILSEIKTISNQLYGNYADGNVKSRVHSVIKDILSTESFT